MNSFLDWILDKLCLADTKDEFDEPEQYEDDIEKSWLELIPWKKENVVEEGSHIFFKIVRNYADCNTVIDNYKRKIVCIYGIEADSNADIQGMMSYMNGALYALDGNVVTVGKHIYMTTSCALSDQSKKE